MFIALILDLKEELSGVHFNWRYQIAQVKHSNHLSFYARSLRLYH
jgi:hypothetical protein